MLSLFGSNNLTKEAYTKDAIYEMQLQVHEIFKSQNPEFFDVTFEIEGKKLYADKLRLSAISSPFQSMLSDRWTSKNEPIKINDYKFEDFKQFLTYIYSGECSLTNENIFVMLDMAEFYQMKHFKEFCDRYLSKMELNLQNVFQFLEISVKYSNLVEMKKSLNDFISINFTNFIKCDDFLKASKFAIEGFLILQPHVIKHEEVFQGVYGWAENQVLKKQNESNEKSFNKNDEIKNEMSDFLKYIEFKKMNLNFFVKYVVKRGFLFSYDDLSDIWETVYSNDGKIAVRNESELRTGLFGSLLAEMEEIDDTFSATVDCKIGIE